MATVRGLVGRETELEQLSQALHSAQQGRGSMFLVSGEAGVGKTSLIDALTSDSDAPVHCGRASEGAPAPYGPIVAALRSYLRSDPQGFDGLGPLRAHLALILPELGDPAPSSDRATLLEAVRRALGNIAGESHVILVLDDLHWSDQATLELLPVLAETLTEIPMLILAAYRSDGLPRSHLLRRVRHELRRSGHLQEVVLAPLDSRETAELLEKVLDEAPSPSLVRTVQDRTQGVPFFVEELAAALSATGSVASGRRGVELAEGGLVPVPDTIRDAVLISTAELSQPEQTALEAAAVAGEDFDVELVGEISSSTGIAGLIERQLISETGHGMGSFRHALTREAIYAVVPWLRRRELHRQLAESLEDRGGASIEIAGHWIGAHENDCAREALLRAAEASRVVHAYRDAAHAGRRALELWPEGGDPVRHIEALESYASSAELAADLAEAARAWREICSLRAKLGDLAEQAATERRLAGVLDLLGDRRAALASRGAAAESFAGAGMLADAASERLNMASYERASANYAAAIELARTAGEEARSAERLDLEARAMGLEGVARAKAGGFDEGLETVHGGLALALAHDLTPVAAELYQRLSLVLYDSADYRQAQTALDTALELCRTNDEPGVEVACVTCMVYVLRERGDWPQALKMGHDLIASKTAVWVAEGLIGSINAFQGKLSSARRLLSSALATSSQVGHYNMTVDSTSTLAWIAAAEGADEQAAELYRSVLDRWQESEDHHYAIRGLRWSAGFFARRGDLGDAHACAEALTRISSATGHTDALAALAHALAETALAEGDAETAAEQLTRAVEFHRSLGIPYERAEIELRAGAALAAAGEREPALEHLGSAYRGARKLGARPLAAEAAKEVAALGESVGRRLGTRAAADAEGAGLTRRELEVVRLVSVGRTNKEIAQELFLSPRTVDMHVRNILRKLDCRSRVEAAHRAGELHLLLD